MNRVIKFRGQRADNKEWVYGFYFVTPLTDENSGTDPDKGWYFLTGEKRHCISNDNGATFVIIPSTIGQFTGLHDKNGKEIYEGDVIMRTDEKATIFYNQPMASFDFENEGGDCEPMVLTDGWHPEAHLVIGNIHQTPTL